jgi:hypothetical protein
MPFSNQFSYKQIIVLRRALDIVLAPNNATTERYRQQVATVIHGLANENEYENAEELAKLALGKLGERHWA